MTTTAQKTLLASLTALTALAMIALPAVAMASESVFTSSIVPPSAWVTPALVMFGSVVAIAIPSLLIGGGISVRNRAALEHTQAHN